jgi:glycosyltransferase involved in cell wall biosynthesis
MNFPLVSVIIPCYNYALYIPETIKSIQSQTYENWELIIVDDGSKDETASVVKPYVKSDERIKYHYQDNAGLSAARNTGLNLTRGKYIQLLDADDYIAPTKIALQVERLEADSSLGLVYGDTYLFKHDAKPANRQFKKFMLSKTPLSGQGGELALHMADDNIFLVSCPLFRRSIVDIIGDFDKTLFSLEDWHFWYRAALSNVKFQYDNQPGTEFYVRSHTTNMSGNRFKMWKYKIQARQKIIMYAKKIIDSGAFNSKDLRSVLLYNTNLLHEEQARFEFLFGKIPVGFIKAAQCVLAGHKPSAIVYDSAYWVKERLLGRNKIPN